VQVTVVIHLKYTLPQSDPRPAATIVEAAEDAVTFLKDGHRVSAKRS